MINAIERSLRNVRGMQRVNMALSRGAAMSALRQVDPRDPRSWEFSGFSQNGEDGILEVLSRHLAERNRYFIEIGASDGLENNTTWLAVAARYSGLWIEGDPTSSKRLRDLFTPLNYGVQSLSMFVDRENVGQLLAKARHTDPDVFSLDIDGNDYHLAKVLFDAGLRPRICVVEYNSAFGPDAPLTIPYRPDFRLVQQHGASLYYGCSLGAWRALFTSIGYRFVTVEQNGVNAFFVDPAAIDARFLDQVEGVSFVESFSHAREYGGTWQSQFALIENLPFHQVT